MEAVCWWISATHAVVLAIYGVDCARHPTTGLPQRGENFPMKRSLSSLCIPPRKRGASPFFWQPAAQKKGRQSRRFAGAGPPRCIRCPSLFRYPNLKLVDHGDAWSRMMGNNSRSTRSSLNSTLVREMGAVVVRSQFGCEHPKNAIYVRPRRESCAHYASCRDSQRSNPGSPE